LSSSHGMVKYFSLCRPKGDSMCKVFADRIDRRYYNDRQEHGGLGIRNGQTLRIALIGAFLQLFPALRLQCR
jgi:hypothetical protein